MKKNVWVGALGAGIAFVTQAADVPDLLKTAGGETVTSSAVWEKVRRPEVLELFRSQVFGRNPLGRPDSLRFEETDKGTEMMNGTALRKQVTLHYTGPGGEGAIRVIAFFPKAVHPAPSFLLICNRNPEENIDPSRMIKSPFWPAEELIARGYATLAFFNGDVDPDVHDGFTNGVHGVFQPDPSVRTADSWGTIAAWAWGASRVIDWIETEALLDAQRIIVVGHSRGGKTALWCGANDPRVALAISNESGCGGAKFNRMDLPESEHIAQITKQFPHWFCSAFNRYANNEDALPIDQHELLALMAPRLVYVASAADNAWAGPPGEFRSCQLASPVWALYGKTGLVGDAFPAPGTALQDGCVGYHLRPGKHDLTREDWSRFMDFADHHLKAKK